MDGFIKGMLAGVVFGAAVMVVADPLSPKQRHKIKRRTEGLFKSVGTLLDTAIEFVH